MYRIVHCAVYKTRTLLVAEQKHVIIGANRYEKSFVTTVMI
jgi:hypothetical protein